MGRYRIYICPTCKGRYRKSTAAFACMKKHQLLKEEWWECHKCGFGIRIDNRTENSLQAEIRQHDQIYCAGTKEDLWRYKEAHE